MIINRAMFFFSSLFRKMLVVFSMCLFTPTTYSLENNPDRSNDLTTFRQIDVANYSSEYALGKDMAIYEDIKKTVSLDEIRKIPQDKWFNLSSEIPSFGYTQSAYWMRLEIINTATSNDSFMLSIENSALDDVQVYLEKDSKIYKTSYFGDKYSFEEREILNRIFVLPFELLSHDRMVIYLRVINKGSVQVPVFLRTVNNHNEYEQYKSLGWGIYFGIMLIMSVYNIILFSSIREKAYLYFSLYIMASMFFHVALNGFGFQFIWPKIESINSWAIPFSNALLYVTSCVFIGEFIDVKKLSLVQYNSLRAIIYVSLMLAGVSPFIPYQYSVFILTFMAIPFSIVAVLVSLTALRKGIAFARFFLWSWIVFVVFLVILAINKMGIIPRNFFTENGSQLGNIISVLFMSIALADRINLERLKRKIADREAMRLEKLSRKEQEKYLQLDLKRKEEELEVQKTIITAREEVLLAQAQNKTKSGFLAVMSHEIRTPLNGILGMSELLWETKLNKDQLHYLRVIKNSGKSLLNIVNNILDFSKIEAGKMEIEEKGFDLKKLCKEVTDNFYVLAKEKHILFRLQMEVDVPYYVRSDANRLRQILLNLVGNSIKFTEKGEIVLKVSLPVVDEWHSDKPLIKFEVLDQGIGISAEQQKKLFQSFSQADDSTTRKYGGTGLGLSICKRLVELMNGKIGVNSELNEGSNFWFTIQCGKLQSSELKYIVDENNESDKPQKNVQYANKLRGINILIAEDNKVNQLVIKNMVGVFGLTCHLVENGEEALAYVREHHRKLDFILMDCDMPIMDGYDASKQIRQWEIEQDKPRVPIFALTAHALDAHKTATGESGMDAHISKPVSLKILYETIIANQSIVRRMSASQCDP